MPDSLNPGFVQITLLCQAFLAQADGLSLAEPLRVGSRAREGEEGFSVTQGIAEVLPKLQNQRAWGSEDTEVAAGVMEGVVYYHQRVCTREATFSYSVYKSDFKENCEQLCFVQITLV